VLPRLAQDPDGGQFRCPVQLRQLRQNRRITAIGLYPIARFDWDQRWRNHNALMPGIGQQSLKTITTGTRFVTKAEPPAFLAEARHPFIQNIRPVLKDTDLSYFAVPAILGDGYAQRRLMHIQPKKK
jgi:hypothetical protein